MLKSLLSSVGVVCLASLAVSTSVDAATGGPSPATKVGDDPWSLGYLLTTTPWGADVGVCLGPTIGGGELFNKFYCDTVAGGFVYAISFTDDACTVPRSGVQTSTNGYSSPDAMVFCQAYDASPVQPLGLWPPAGWFSKQTNYDATTGLQTCTAADEVTILFQSLEIMPLGQCQPRLLKPYPGAPGVPSASTLYDATYCTTDASQYGVASFTDDACTTTPVLVTLLATGCHDSTNYQCPSPGVNFPSVMPTASLTTYTTTDCTTSEDTVVNLYAQDTCTDSFQVACSQEGDDYYFTFTTYTDPTSTGLCPDMTSANPTNNWSSVRYKTATCFASNDGITSTQYYCPTAEDLAAAAAKKLQEQKVVVEEKDL